MSDWTSNQSLDHKHTSPLFIITHHNKHHGLYSMTLLFFLVSFAAVFFYIRSEKFIEWERNVHSFWCIHVLCNMLRIMWLWYVRGIYFIVWMIAAVDYNMDVGFFNSSTKCNEFIINGLVNHYRFHYTTCFYLSTWHSLLEQFDLGYTTSDHSEENAVWFKIIPGITAEQKYK